jgi:hypothetical protein
MAQQLAGTCNPHLNTKCFNLNKQLRPAVRLLSITGLYRTRTSGNNTSTFLAKLNNTVPVVLFNYGKQQIVASMVTLEALTTVR